MSDVRSSDNMSGSASRMPIDKHKAQTSTSMQPHGETKAVSDRGTGGQMTTRPTYDPFAMRLGFGNWDNWGFLQPSLLDQPLSTMLEPFGGWQRTSAVMNDMIRVPTLDLNETDRGYELHCDLPGIPKEQVKIDLNGRTLTISAERKEERSTDRTFSRSFGTFSRSLVLPSNSDLDHIDAKHEHGQLKLCVPKLARSVDTPRSIRIA